ncbi:MAG: response regulator [Treponema sp.]|jgi:putative two-component system response regulator|nr:response regulator [Treponema sp.]
MKKILMVDDQAASINLVSYFLDGKYDLYSAKTIAQAFSLLRSNTFDLILLDVLMPGMSGIEFFQYIQDERQSAKTPVIFVSSESDINVVSQAIKLGAMGYIKKPIDAERLINKIQAAIGK